MMETNGGSIVMRGGSDHAAALWISYRDQMGFKGRKVKKNMQLTSLEMVGD